VNYLAETVAQTCLISRDEQDEFALQSQLKCAHAMSLGHFEAEIEPIILSSAKNDVQISKDEYPRPNATIEGLAKLKTAFKEGSSFPF